jgi:DNA-binding beta-propeller fold protein YncE
MPPDEERLLAWPVRKKGIMKLTQRAVALITAAISLFGTATIATAPAASASLVSSTAQAATAAIRVKATIPVDIFPAGIAVNPKTNTIYVANVEFGTTSAQLRSGPANHAARRPPDRW